MDIKKVCEKAIQRRVGYIVEKKDVNEKTLKKIKKMLTLKPKVHRDYAKFVKPFPVFLENKNTLYIPTFWALTNLGPAKFDEMFDGEEFITKDLQIKFPPRDYQHPIIDTTYKQLIKINGAIITVGVGLGKTYMAIKLALMLKQKTLIIVHKSVLLDQWIERLNDFAPGCKIGICRGKKCELEDVDFVIGMLQTIISKSKGFTNNTFKKFGTTIVDEVHNIAAPTFSRALPIISTKYKIGLSATPERNDGLENIFYWYLGDSSWYSKKPLKDQHSMVKIVEYYDDNMDEIRRWDRGYDLPKMTEMIINDTIRNKFILKQIRYLSKKGRQILVLSTRKAHLTTLKENFERIKPDGVTAGYYVGGMKSKDLAISAKCNAIFATYQLVSEGTDIPTLNTMIMCSPKKDVQQVVGRILRGKTEHKPMVLDICDMFSIYKNQGKFRQKYYKRMGFDVEKMIVDASGKLPLIKDTDKNKCLDIKKFVKKKEKKEDIKFEGLMICDDD